MKKGKKKRIHRPEPVILGKLSLQVSSVSISWKYEFEITSWCAGPVRDFLLIRHMNPEVSTLEFGGTRIGQ